MVVTEGTVNALNITRFDQLMVMYDELSVEEDRSRLILSRSPTRRLLRHLSPHMTTFRWLTHLEANDSIHLSTEAIKSTIGAWAPEHTQGVVILEGLDAVFDEEGPVPVFALMAWLTELSQLHRLSIHLVLDPLTFPSNVWMRMSPLIASTVEEPPAPELSTTNSVPTVEVESLRPIEQEVNQPVLAQLVALPKLGFHRGLLSKRMLQWRRMGFDLTELEPALSMGSNDEAYAVYREVEDRIRDATEALLHLHASSDMFTVAELERWSYRLLNLVEVEETSARVLSRTSSS